MSKSISILLLLLCACAPPNYTSFGPVYAQFLADAKSHGYTLNQAQLTVSISFAQLGQGDSLGEVIGECTQVGYGVGGILIDEQYWYNSIKPLQEILLYHELGHCVLGEDHTPNDTESIMYPVINPPELDYASGWSLMVDKLFGRVGQ